MSSVKSLYMHFPFCQHLCNYCDFYKHKLTSHEQVLDFEKKVLAGIKKNEELLERYHYKFEELETLYLGGGTPSLWGKRGAEFIKKEIIDRYKLARSSEFTLELDPDTWKADDIQAWTDAGVTRFSVGAQSFNPFFIKMMDRQHSVEQIRNTLESLRSCGADYSVDLMLGLPGSLEERRNISLELEKLIELGATHFSVYILKTRANYPHKSILPNDEYIEKEYLDVCRFLDENDFKQYEVSNFAKDSKLSKHNMKYWKCESVAAIGDNATGFLRLEGNSALRYQWRSFSGEAGLEDLSATDLLLEKVYLGLRSQIGFDFSPLHNKSLDEIILKWENLGYIDSNENLHIKLSSQGYLMLDSLMGDLFAYDIV